MLIAKVIARVRLIMVFRYRHWRRRLRGGRFPVVAFYPQIPWARAAVYKICHIIGATIVGQAASAADLVINWEDTTRRHRYPELVALAADRPVLNLGCLDISKLRVEEIHREIFGYGSHVDPLVHEGPCVRKSDQNAQHDGTIVECPLAAVDSGFVYQRVIDNRSGDSLALDIRVPVFGSTIPFCYLKRRPLAQRFSNENTAVDLLEVAAAFTPHEIDLLLQFSTAIGLDYGELDVLRDRVDRRIYVVDVNNTPDGPPNHLPAAQAEIALQRMAASFTRAFLPAFEP